jgi:hypothetical protein
LAVCASNTIFQHVGRIEIDFVNVSFTKITVLWDVT